MVINSIDSTRFDVDLVGLYHEVIQNQLISNILDYTASDLNQSKTHQFDLLFLTPSNMASNFYKTDFFLTTILIDGVKVREKQDIPGAESYVSDLTNLDEQLYFTFTE